MMVSLPQGLSGRFILLAGVFACQGVVADDWGGLPPGDGRDETYMFCSACHSTRLITQQGMSREGWDKTLKWMVEEKGMPELPPDTRGVILDYLSEKFSPERPYYKPDH